MITSTSYFKVAKNLGFFALLCLTIAGCEKETSFHEVSTTAPDETVSLTNRSSDNALVEYDQVVSDLALILNEAQKLAAFRTYIQGQAGHISDNYEVSLLAEMNHAMLSDNLSLRKHLATSAYTIFGEGNTYTESFLASTLLQNFPTLGLGLYTPEGSDFNFSTSPANVMAVTSYHKSDDKSSMTYLTPTGILTEDPYNDEPDAPFLFVDSRTSLSVINSQNFSPEGDIFGVLSTIEACAEIWNSISQANVLLSTTNQYINVNGNQVINPEYGRVLLDLNVLLSMYNSLCGSSTSSGPTDPNTLEPRTATCPAERLAITDDEYFSGIDFNYGNNQSLRKSWCNALFNTTCRIQIDAILYTVTSGQTIGEAIPRPVTKYVAMRKGDVKNDEYIAFNQPLTIWNGTWQCEEGLAAQSMLYNIVGKNDDGSGDAVSIDLGYEGQFESEDSNGNTIMTTTSSEITIAYGEEDALMGNWYANFCDEISPQPPGIPHSIGTPYSGANYYTAYIREALHP